MLQENLGIYLPNHIIPHNGAVRQAELSPNRQQIANQPHIGPVPTPRDESRSPIQQQAFALYDLGFNVFPQPYGKKAGLPWKRLQYTRLHRDHQQYGLDTIFSGYWNIAVMCGRTSGNLFVIDCETKTSFEFHTHEIQKRNMPLWAAASARGGHIYLRCRDGEVANIDKGTLSNVEIRGCRCYVLAPPSIHPTGAIYTWTSQQGSQPPEVNLGDIDWLHTLTGKAISLRLDQPKSVHTSKIEKSQSVSHKPSPLSRATLDYLANGQNIPEGERNNRLFKAACDLSGNHHSEQHTAELLTPIAKQSGLPDNEIHHTIRSAYSRDRQPSKPTKSQQYQDWEYALLYAENNPWEGRTGNSDKATFLSLIKRAQLDSNENGTFRASIREISTQARTGSATTQKALKRLQNPNQPLIQKIGNDKMSTASLWRFSSQMIEQAKHMKTDTLSPSPLWKLYSVSVSQRGDLLERGALGMNGWSVYQALSDSDEPLLPKSLSERCGLRVYQVAYALRKLSDFDLARRESTGWVAKALDVDVVCQSAGTLGKGEARERRYADERAVYVGRLLSEACLCYNRSNVRYIEFSTARGMVGKSKPAVLQSECSDSRLSHVGIAIWECPNCGQTHFGETPPDMCEVCADFTTWRKVSPDSDDPLLMLGVELGGVLDTQYQPGANPWLRTSNGGGESG